MPTVKIHEAKTHLSQLIAKVEAGQEVTILRGDRPVARLVPIADQRLPRQPGRLEGRIAIAQDAFAPLSDDALEAWEGGP